MKNWFLKTQRIFETQTNATVLNNVFGLKSVLKEVRPQQNGNLVLSYDYEISLNGKSLVPEVEKIDIPDYTSTVEEAVIIQEEYFAGFMNLYKSSVPLSIKLTQANMPENLPFTLNVRDFVHIVFATKKFDDNQGLAVACQWGDKDTMVNITTKGLEGNVPIKCSMSTDQAIKPTGLLDFSFTLRVYSKPLLLRLSGGTYINFGLTDVEVLEYEDNQPGNVIDHYMI